ncbi:GGDEF domain-containing protein [Actinoplanes sichuanensis]|uniref:GGDEF domain-containing protein n=1 Tax=Actinoplanes sichuanensis TaxID=512349 RepID=A0ABW4AUG1_9ACTN|nr:GGDEF domain-containing protein [Actinoplanes sichuanensis]
MRVGRQRGAGVHRALVHAGFVVLVLVAVAAWAFGGLAVRLGVVTVIGALPAAGIAVGMRINRIVNRTAWYLLLAASVLFTIFNYLWFVQLGLGRDVGADGPANLVLQVLAYSSIMLSALQVIRKHGEGDRGGIIDATLLGVGLITPVWEFVLRPHLLELDVSGPSQGIYLLKMLLLTGTLGALLRIARTAGTARTSLIYFFLSLGATVVSVVSSLLSTRPGSDYYSPLVDLFAMIGYLGLTAAALHPSSTEFTQPAGWRRNRLRPVRLSHLGFVLAMVPVVGGIPELFGGTTDNLLLTFGTLLVIPLVVSRIGLLIAERTADQEALRHQAHHDELTGLVNRRRFFTLLEEAVRSGAGVAVLYCDLDRFKAINDEYGHEAGDEVLRVFADRLRGTLRGEDVAARIGGDEFLILGTGTTAGDAEVLRRRIEDATSVPAVWRGHHLSFGVTVGVAYGSDADTSADGLMSAADADMYRHKNARRASGTPASSAPRPAPDRHVRTGGSLPNT